VSTGPSQTQRPVALGHLDLHVRAPGGVGGRGRNARSYPIHHYLPGVMV